MNKILEVRPLERYQIWLKFADGTEGDIDPVTGLDVQRSPSHDLFAFTPTRTLHPSFRASQRARQGTGSLPPTSNSRRIAIRAAAPAMSRRKGRARHRKC